MTKLSITGMTCGHCQKAVEEALESVEGAQDVNVDLASGTATVAGAADPARLVAAVEDEGYGAQVAA